MEGSGKIFVECLDQLSAVLAFVEKSCDLLTLQLQLIEAVDSFLFFSRNSPFLEALEDK